MSTTSDLAVFVFVQAKISRPHNGPLLTLCEAKENVNNMNFGHYLAWKAKENAKTLL